LMDIIEIGEGEELTQDVLASNYFRLGKVLQLDWMREAITRLPRDNRWQSLARSALRDDLYRLHRKVAKLAIQECKGSEDLAGAWLEKRHHDVETCHQMFAELQAFQSLDLAMLSAGMRELNNHLLA
ncbi:MAG TPA: hypothetical protein VJ575_08165, partial [Pseudogulbenkiania sp.]|nr:hypothetical protein [Pseudogulbenkiania sp.]